MQNVCPINLGGDILVQKLFRLFVCFPFVTIIVTLYEQNKILLYFISLDRQDVHQPTIGCYDTPALFYRR